jgi:hypothetical protein
LCTSSPHVCVDVCVTAGTEAMMTYVPDHARKE